MTKVKPSSCEKWLPEDGIRVITGIPPGNVEAVPPTLENENLSRLEQDLGKFRLKFDQSNQDWWSFFIAEQRNRMAQNTQNTVNWPLPFLLPEKRNVRANKELPSSDELKELLSKEEKVVEININTSNVF